MAKSKTVIMPRELTAENGAKALLNGEFFERVEVDEDCEACNGEGVIFDQVYCDVCDGEQTISKIREVPVSWTTIKAIYKKAVEHFEGNL